MRSPVSPQVNCNTCSRESITFDPFKSISVPLPVPTDRAIQVTLVWQDGNRSPMRLQVKVEKAGAIGQLKAKVAALTDIDAENLLCVDLWNHRIHTLRDDNSKVSVIQARDETFFYELARMVG